MFENWYALSMIALLLMGSQRFLYKVSAQRGCNSSWTTFTFMGTVTFLSAISLFISRETLPSIPFLVFIALVNSLSFTLATLTHMEALKHLPGSVAYPIIRLNAAVVVIFSMIFFRDRLSGYQIIGILIAVAAIATLARGPNGQNTLRPNTSKGLCPGFRVLALRRRGFHFKYNSQSCIPIGWPSWPCHTLWAPCFHGHLEINWLWKGGRGDTGMP
jgi:drug/metabolite transporter (DMT)-like permease